MTPDFKHQLVGALRLLAAVIENGHESEQADVARENLDDGSWHRLSLLEQHRLRTLSTMIDKWERSDDQPA